MLWFDPNALMHMLNIMWQVTYFVYRLLDWDEIDDKMNVFPSRTYFYSSLCTIYICQHMPQLGAQGKPTKQFLCVLSNNETGMKYTV